VDGRVYNGEARQFGAATITNVPGEVEDDDTQRRARLI